VLNRIRSENFQKTFQNNGLSMDMKYECEAGYI